MKLQLSPKPLNSQRPADAWLVSSARPQDSTGGVTVSKRHFPVCFPKRPKGPPARQRIAYLQFGLLAPYAISTQDTAKQALKGNQTREFPTASLAHSKLCFYLLSASLSKHSIISITGKETVDLEIKFQGNTQILQRSLAQGPGQQPFLPVLTQLLLDPNSRLAFQHRVLPALTSR